LHVSFASAGLPSVEAPSIAASASGSSPPASLGAGLELLALHAAHVNKATAIMDGSGAGVRMGAKPSAPAKWE
jgi:hypothetical protein